MCLTQVVHKMKMFYIMHFKQTQKHIVACLVRSFLNIAFFIIMLTSFSIVTSYVLQDVEQSSQMTYEILHKSLHFSTSKYSCYCRKEQRNYAV